VAPRIGSRDHGSNRGSNKTDSGAWHACETGSAIRTPGPFSGACGRVIGRMASILVSMNRSASDISVYCVYFLNRRRKTVDLRTCGGGG
jgi:hypothetical protein